MRYNQDFCELVYDLVRQIPYGRVSTYGLIAKRIYSKGSARMVGWALNQVHGHHPDVPAHRVVNRNGILTGKHHFKTPTQMEELLKAEGIQVENDQVINFKEVVWMPM